MPRTKSKKPIKEPPKIYVVRLDDRGYYSPKPWTPVPLEEASVLTSKQARKVRDRMISHNHNFPKATIEIKA